MWIPIIIPFGTRLKSKVVDNKVRTCINCKNNGVQLLKNDEYFHIFFVPLAKVNKGNEYLHCPSCGATWPYVEREHYPTFNNPNQDVNFEPAKKKDKKRWRKKHKYDGPPKAEQQQQTHSNPPPDYYQQQPNYYNQQPPPPPQQQYPQMSQEYYNQQPQFKSEEQQKYFNDNQPIGPPDKNYNYNNEFTLDKNKTKE